jgi:hypothetical protein
MKPLSLHKPVSLTLCFLQVLVMSVSAQADGIVVDKIYHPYVDALEQELEYRAVAQDTQPGVQNLAQVHQLSLGTAIGPKVFAELYVVGAKNRAAGFETQAWEAEVKWQLTEQGEYWADWGLLVEYEEELPRSAHEVSVGLLAEKELGRWSAAANFLVINEWGSEVVDEVESVLALQARYRYSEKLEPTLEFYAGQDNRALGPTLQGSFRTGARQSLHWEAGVLFGLTKTSPDTSWRFLLEYEF